MRITTVPKIAEHIKQAIVEQERLGLDVLVHGEAERNDMVEYFGEHLDGFVFTQNGWVQSYGSRCVKPCGRHWRCQPPGTDHRGVGEIRAVPD